MKNVLKLLLIIFFAPGFGCTHLQLLPECPECPEIMYLDVLPELGEVLPVSEESLCYILTSSSSFDPCYDVVIRDLSFNVAVQSSDNTVVYISTSDPDFSTSEGYRVGTPFEPGMVDNGMELNQERGWGCFTPLPSGWNAALSSPESESFKNGEWIDCEDRLVSPLTIGWFFKRL
ncbi:hypothetical protein K8T06_06915 [bacterium]|nr:hypothetical protein [bacterium]